MIGGNMMKLKVLVIFAVFSITFANVTSNNNPGEIIQNPGIFVGVGSSMYINTLDPATNADEGISIIQSMYEGLYQYANNSVKYFKPDLATGYTISADGLTYTFTIRTGVAFTLQAGETVGQPFNAYVMQYSIDRAIIMNDPYGPVWLIQDWIKGAQIFEGNSINLTQASTFLALKSVWATDATHLQITLRTRFGGFLSTLLFPVSFAISPKAIIDNKPTSYTTNPDPVYGVVSLASFFPGTPNSTILRNLGLPGNYKIDNSVVVPQSGQYNVNKYEWLQDHSAGTGPYILTDLVQYDQVDLIKNDHADLIKNTNWWDSAEFHQNSPNSIKLLVDPDDTARVQAFVNGAVDVASIPGNLWEHFGVTSTHPISNTTGITAYVGNMLTTYAFGMNQGDSLGPGQGVEDPTSNYNYGTKNVTRLLKYSWNYPNGSQIMASPGNPFSSLLFREAFANSFNYDQYFFQLTMGFTTRMQGAIPYGLLGHNDNLILNGNIPSLNLTKAKELFNQVGWKGTITMYYNTGGGTRQLADKMLKNAVESLNVGISINIIETSWISFVDTFPQTGIFLVGINPDYADPYENVVSYYLGYESSISESIAVPENYNNPEVNSLIEAGNAATSPSERDAIYQQMEVNASGDYPYIYLIQSKWVFLIRDWIIGVGDPASNTLNPFAYNIPVQFLGKGGNNILTSLGSTSTSTTTSQNSKLSSTPGFTGSTIWLTLIIVLIIIKRKKIQ